MVLCPGCLLILKLAVRLINVTTKALEHFVDDSKDPPPYAILSHTWGADDEEISFQELQGSKKNRGLGQYKFDQCCSQAIRDGLSYVWIDTCCIDKTNSTELSEAINSMFKWYKNAQVCYAYLCDVDIGEDPQKPESSFWKSRWFQRGWTLQELLAPAAVTFYDTKWNELGTKHSLESPLFHITRIPEIYLLGNFPLHDASVAQRMSWAAGRVTKRKEDLAYCLLGIFGITMSMIYGEGAEAFMRLQKKIASRIGDDSILAWNFGNYSSTNKPSKALSVGALASSPSCFANSSHITSIDPRRSAFGSPRTRGTILSVRRCLHKNSLGQCFVILQCQQEGQGVVGIPVEARPGGDFNYIRLDGQPAILLPEDVSQTNPEDVRILVSHSEAYNTETRYSFYIENTIGKDLKLIEVTPHSNWQQGKSTFFINDDAGPGRLRRIWTMFRYQQGISGDFILVLDIILRKSKPQVRHHVMICDRGVELDEIRNHFAIFDWRDLNKHIASNGALNLEATISRGKFGKSDMFVVRLLQVERASDTYNVTEALHRFKREQEVVAYWKLYHQLDIEDKSLDNLIQNQQKEIDLTRKQLAKLEEEMITLQKGQRKLRQVQKIAAPLDYEPDAMRDMLPKQAQALRTRFDQRYRDIDLAEETFQDWNEAVAKEIVRRLPSEERKSYEWDPEPAHRFILAAARLGYESPFRQLAKRGLDVNIATREGASLIAIAAIHGHKLIVQALLILGADIRRVDEDAWSALHDASYSGNADITRLLLDYGAETEAKDKAGWTALMYAAQYGHEAVIQALVEHGAEIEAKDKAGWTALMYAAQHGHKAVIQVLVDYGAETETKDNAGWTPLMIAAQYGHEAVIQVLVEHGAEIEAKNLVAGTALMIAAKNGEQGITKQLLDFGANKGATDNMGRTARDWATEKRREAIVELLDS
ncbi:hypothetical protein E0Z10_g3758 [Xylaria hypoxylon]|uniref:Heterokaryon incompatibility domain-containing protein n=1 Tax=Xylaria hypoxylon TaxID=37992 RepID=A0A4Z0YMN9_9PEZI|nr:hypothetical protein E0Z10_g3758 [Xylaria hypoxylon]